MGQFRDVLVLLSRLKAEGVIQDYAIGGAVAVSLWTEPVATQDLDVIVTIPGDPRPLDPLRPRTGDCISDRSSLAGTLGPAGPLRALVKPDPAFAIGSCRSTLRSEKSSSG
jgi:hypothetical protein